jgi:hypothetical protein
MALLLTFDKQNAYNSINTLRLNFLCFIQSGNIYIVISAMLFTDKSKEGYSMFKKGFQLSKNAQFTAALHNQTTIQAWQDGQALHHGGLIQSFTSHTVKIDNDYFMRAACTFIVR